MSDWSKFIDAKTYIAIGKALALYEEEGFVSPLIELKKERDNWLDKHTSKPTTLKDECDDSCMLLEIDNRFLGIRNLSNSRLEGLVTESIDFLEKNAKWISPYSLLHPKRNVVRDILKPKGTYVGELYKYTKNKSENTFLIIRESHKFQRNVYLDCGYTDQPILENF